MTWSIDGVSRRKQHEQGHHQREADRKHPLTGSGAYPFGRHRRVRQHHGAHRTGDQIFAADQRNQPVRRLWQEHGEEDANADARAPQREEPRTASHVPAAGTRTAAGRRDRTAPRRTATRSGCRTSARAPTRRPRARAGSTCRRRSPSSSRRERTPEGRRCRPWLPPPPARDSRRGRSATRGAHRSSRAPACAAGSRTRSGFG